MKKLSFFASALAAVTIGFSMPAFSGTYSIGANTGCSVKLGTGTGAGDNGLKNNTSGSIVVACSVPRAGNVSTVRVRMRNAQTGGSSNFCDTRAYSTTGGSESMSTPYFFSSSAGAYDKAINLPSTQYNYGYFDVWCVLAPGDTLYGIRYTN